MTDDEFAYGSLANLFGSDVDPNPVQKDIDDHWEVDHPKTKKAETTETTE